ncbi:Blue copper protein [Striga hermonthica]|uniref:Blue copper protein n=1 Tax=Striga hermonthica TaxID=68872 RepID=A0A9N7NEN7_STRHE|nr:Blue copper protein [Striga hermonthica]
MSNNSFWTVFNFTTNFHDVARVSRDAYNRCSVNAIIGSPITTGPANITLSSTGNQYYICTFGTHCAQGGQRLSINVVSNSASRGASPPAASPPAAAPPPAATPPAAAPPTTTPGDSPSALPAAPSAQPPATPGQLGSGAGSLARSFLFVLASVGVYLVV